MVMWQTRSCGLLPPLAPRETALQIHSLEKDQHSQSKGEFLLNSCVLHTIVKPKRSDLEHLQLFPNSLPNLFITYVTECCFLLCRAEDEECRALCMPGKRSGTKDRALMGLCNPCCVLPLKHNPLLHLPGLMTFTLPSEGGSDLVSQRQSTCRSCPEPVLKRTLKAGLGSAGGSPHPHSPSTACLNTAVQWLYRGAGPLEHTWSLGASQSASFLLSP